MDLEKGGVRCSQDERGPSGRGEKTQRDEHKGGRMKEYTKDCGWLKRCTWSFCFLGRVVHPKK